MKIILAPIKGITDAIFRQTIAKHFKGIDRAIAPFISSVKSRKLKGSYFKDLLPENNEQLQVIPQILSNDPEDFLFIAERLNDLGYTSVNWNLGCPVSMVAKKKRGSGLLLYPERITSFLDKVFSSITINLSIKTRLGRLEPDELYELLPIFNQYPIEEITIHPRLGIQLYKGQADPDNFAECLKLTKHSIIYNGDIIDVETYKYLAGRFPDINKWMIGRGLLANPFLAETIKNIQKHRLKMANERFIIKNYHDDLFSSYQEALHGPSHLMGRMKGIWVYLGAIFTNRVKLIKIINKIKDPKLYLKTINSMLENEELNLTSK